MNPGSYFMPNMAMNPMMRMVPNTVMNNFMMQPKTGFITRALRDLKAFNWSGLLSGANKTLNVVNQTIPLIRQVKPMVNNVRSMFKLAKAFNNETRLNKVINGIAKKQVLKKEVVSSSLPNFFI